MLRDLLAYDEQYVGTDWDSVDALAYAKMRAEDMNTTPRKTGEVHTDTFDEPQWKFDASGNAILVSNHEPKARTLKHGEPLETNGGWRSGFRYEEEGEDEFKNTL